MNTKMFQLKVILFIAFFVQTVAQTDSDVACPLGQRYRTKAKPYFPSLEKGGFVDMTGNKLNTIQEFLDGKADFVSLSLDSKVPVPIGTPMCIPEINRKYNKNVIFQYRDTGSDLQEKGFSECHVCVQNADAANEKIFDQFLTLVVPKVV